MAKRVLYLVGLCMSASAMAAPEPQATELGGGKLIPQLSVGLKHDDNIFSQASSEQSDTILTLKPSVQWLQEKDTTSVALSYTGDYGVYQDSDDDDYDDHTPAISSKQVLAPLMAGCTITGVKVVPKALTLRRAVNLTSMKSAA